MAYIMPYHYILRKICCKTIENEGYATDLMARMRGRSIAEREGWLRRAEVGVNVTLDNQTIGIITKG